MHTALLEYIFGLKPDYRACGSTRADPAWTDFSVLRHFRGASYQVNFRNPQGVEHGIKSISMDGNPIEGNLLPVFTDGKTHEVEVLMGN